MKDLKIRLYDDAMVEDIDLWLASGTARVSRARLLNILLEAFHAEITDREATFPQVNKCVRTAIQVGKVKLDKERFGEPE
jgi:hypothetical protein